MKKGLLFFIFIMAVLWTKGQLPDNIRFIAGYPNYEYDLAGGEINEVYTAAILKRQGDSLVQDMLLCDSLNILSYLRYYYSNHIITALLAQKENKDNSIADLGYRIIMLDTRTMDTTIIVIPKTVSVYGVQYKLLSSAFSVLSDNENLSYALEYFNFDLPKKGSKPRLIDYNINPSNHKLEISNPIQFRKIIASGSSATPYLFNNRRGDGVILKSDMENNLLRIASGLDVDSIYPLVLPKEFKLPSIYGATVIINNPKMEAMYFYEYTDSSMICRILNKKTQEWDKLDLIAPGSGGKLIMKDFGNWIVGCNRVSTGHPNPKVNQLPGQDAWKNQSTIYSPSTYKLLDEYEHFYAEGYLYFYNIDTKNYIEWNTKQADSEILMVRNDTVYYRKYDAIYMAPIIDGKKLGKSILLISSKEVPSIHFIFFKGE